LSQTEIICHETDYKGHDGGVEGRYQRPHRQGSGQNLAGNRIAHVRDAHGRSQVLNDKNDCEKNDCSKAVVQIIEKSAEDAEAKAYKHCEIQGRGEHFEAGCECA